MAHIFQPRGSEFLVNTTTAGSQGSSTITYLASGRFVICWRDNVGDNAEIKAQIYDAAGNRIAGEFLVNTTRLGEQFDPDVTALTGGGFVVTWTDNSLQGGDSSAASVKAQIFDGSGAKVGSELLVNTTTSLAQYNPSVAQLTSGGFVVCWTDDSGPAPVTPGDGGGDLTVKAQMFGASGNRVGGEILLNTFAVNDPGNDLSGAKGAQDAVVAGLPTGGFVVAWYDHSIEAFVHSGGGEPGAGPSDGWETESHMGRSGGGIAARMFNASGQPVTGEILVNTVQYSRQIEPAIAALASGGFVVTWTNQSGFEGRPDLGDGSRDFSVQGQIFGASGNKVGSEFLVNTTAAGFQESSKVAAHPSGGFIVTWNDDSTSNFDIRAQSFNSDGSKSGGEALINSTTAFSQVRPDIAVSSGALVISWSDNSGQGGDISEFGIKARVFVLTDDTGGAITGTSGNDNFSGTPVNDFFFLQQGGDDTASGGGGNDAFYFGGAYTAADNVDGGEGKDVVALQGNYAGLTLGAGSLVNVETLSLLTGADTRFGDTANNRYSYNLATVDANVAAGTQLIVNAAALLPGENLTFNGSAETNGSFLIYGGMGTDVLTGGAGADVFFFAEGRFNSGADRIDGGGGADIVALRGDATLTFAADAFTGIETISLISAADTRFFSGGERHNYNLTTNDGNVAAGATLTVNGGQLRGGETLRFDGSAETNGAFRIFGGADVDVLRGGGGADLLYGGLGGDELRGGLGNDVFRYQSVAESNAAGGRDRILDFTRGDLMDLSRIDAIAGTPENDTFRFIGNNAFSGAAGELRIGFNSDGTRAVMGDIDGDRVADFEITVFLNAPSLTPSDFVL